MPFCRLASALIKLASTAKASPPTRPSLIQRCSTVSKTRRNRSLWRKRPCRFLEKVEFNQGASRAAVERRQLSSYVAKLDEPIDQAQQMIRWNVLV
jgi:hypothetical protein